MNKKIPSDPWLRSQHGRFYTRELLLQTVGTVAKAAHCEHCRSKHQCDDRCN
jgi:hypothetical protein